MLSPFRLVTNDIDWIFYLQVLWLCSYLLSLRSPLEAKQPLFNPLGTLYMMPRFNSSAVPPMLFFDRLCDMPRRILSAIFSVLGSLFSIASPWRGRVLPRPRGAFRITLLVRVSRLYNSNIKGLSTAIVI
jgi:hypothetical protein